jgi:hypothetical protein
MLAVVVPPKARLAIGAEQSGELAGKKRDVVALSGLHGNAAKAFVLHTHSPPGFSTVSRA